MPRESKFKPHRATDLWEALINQSKMVGLLCAQIYKDGKAKNRENVYILARPEKADLHDLPPGQRSERYRTAKGMNGLVLYRPRLRNMRVFLCMFQDGSTWRFVCQGYALKDQYSGIADDVTPEDIVWHKSDRHETVTNALRDMFRQVPGHLLPPQTMKAINDSKFDGDKEFCIGREVLNNFLSMLSRNADAIPARSQFASSIISRVTHPPFNITPSVCLSRRDGSAHESAMMDCNYLSSRTDYQIPSGLVNSGIEGALQASSPATQRGKRVRLSCHSPDWPLLKEAGLHRTRYLETPESEQPDNVLLESWTVTTPRFPECSSSNRDAAAHSSEGFTSMLPYPDIVAVSPIAAEDQQSSVAYQHPSGSQNILDAPGEQGFEFGKDPVMFRPVSRNSFGDSMGYFGDLDSGDM